jgi:hypothetical protein
MIPKLGPRLHALFNCIALLGRYWQVRDVLWSVHSARKCLDLYERKKGKEEKK